MPLNYSQKCSLSIHGWARHINLGRKSWRAPKLPSLTIQSRCASRRSARTYWWWCWYLHSTRALPCSMISLHGSSPQTWNNIWQLINMLHVIFWSYLTASPPLPTDLCTSILLMLLVAYSTISHHGRKHHHDMRKWTLRRNMILHLCCVLKV